MGLFVLAMLTVMMSFINCADMLQTRAEVGQLARKYILVAETYGYIPEGDCETLVQELESIGVTDVDISASTLVKAEFGHTVMVCIKGKIDEKYDISETRSSTAKY